MKASILNMYDNYYQDYGVAASYANEGTRDWVTPTQRLPQRFGVHYIELRYPNDGTLHVELELDSQGSQGSLAEWPVTLVRVDGEPIYEPLTVQDGSIAYSLEGVGDETAIWLVVGATAQQRRSDETFGYSYRMWVDSEALDSEPADDTGDGEGEKPGGCGCLSGGAMGGAWLGLVALAVVRRRRS